MGVWVWNLGERFGLVIKIWELLVCRLFYGFEIGWDYLTERVLGIEFWGSLIFWGFERWEGISKRNLEERLGGKLRGGGVLEVRRRKGFKKEGMINWVK